MLCSLCNNIFRAPLDFNSHPYKRPVDLHRESAVSDECYMCDCIWRSFIGDDENVEANDSSDYYTAYKFIDQSDPHGHSGLIALIVHINHKSGRIVNPTRRYYPAFRVEQVAPDTTRDYSTNTDSEENWALIKQWLGQCTKGHLKCREHVSRRTAIPPA